ncbi:hypothetical protein KIW84_UN0446 [Lathyrus oleraceus]|nr:hypothetical protein KIW84_UN0446 [Pisum sativum]
MLQGEQPLVDGQCRQGKSAKGIRNLGKRIGSEGWARWVPVPNRRLLGMLSAPAARSGSPRAGRGKDWERALGRFPGQEQSNRNCALNVKVKKFNQARVNGGSKTMTLLSETTAKGTGLAESAGKEDPVELDSRGGAAPLFGSKATLVGRSGPKTLSGGEFGWGGTSVKDNAVRIRTVKAWPIDPLDLRNLKLEGSEKLNRDNWLVAAKRS